MRDGVGLVFEAHHGHDRTEDLLSHRRSTRVAPGPAPSAGTSSPARRGAPPEGDGGAVGTKAATRLAVLGADQRAHLARLVGRVLDPDRLDRGLERSMNAS